ncbi:MAG: hypothetical protein M0Z49_01630 [Chloroflexi bacterium]|nr:hypothetical protein [Chloroflexota bacterium]
MSSRHQQSRRRSYGRRQHELHERRGRETPLTDEQSGLARDPFEDLGEPDLAELAAARFARFSFGSPLDWAKGAA